jgi:ABC transport system ATP-binding/permease protein
MINGKPRHVIGYMQDFLFSPERARTPVKVLSGGERNRLFLARLFTKPSNFLVMDEPTNDLDIETLELLEELLVEYSGTLILVSHDRAFLNNVVTSTMVLEGNGIINEYPGGYDDWLNQRKSASLANPQEKKEVKDTEVQEQYRERRALTHKEERELERLVVKIQKLEEDREAIHALMAEPNFYQKDPQEITKVKIKLELLEDELLEAFQRWEILEESKEKSS